MSLNIVDKSVVKDPGACVAKINGSLKGWEDDTSYIIKSFINKDASIVFDFIKPETATEYSGYAIVKQDPKKSEAAYLTFIAVDQRTQKQGVGGQLLHSTVEKVKKFAYQKLTLHCEEHNLEFYTKFAKRNVYPVSMSEMPYNPFGPGKYYHLTLDLSKEKVDEKGKEVISSSSGSTVSRVSELFGALELSSSSNSSSSSSSSSSVSELLS